MTISACQGLCISIYRFVVEHCGPATFVYSFPSDFATLSRIHWFGAEGRDEGASFTSALLLKSSAESISGMPTRTAT